MIEYSIDNYHPITLISRPYSFLNLTIRYRNSDNDTNFSKSIRSISNVMQSKDIPRTSELKLVCDITQGRCEKCVK